MTPDRALLTLAFAILAFALAETVILVKRAVQHWRRFSRLMDRIAGDIR